MELIRHRFNQHSSINVCHWIKRCYILFGFININVFYCCLVLTVELLVTCCLLGTTLTSIIVFQTYTTLYQYSTRFLLVFPARLSFTNITFLGHQCLSIKKKYLWKNCPNNPCKLKTATGKNALGEVRLYTSKETNCRLVTEKRWLQIKYISIFKMFPSFLTVQISKQWSTVLNIKHIHYIHTCSYYY